MNTFKLNIQYFLPVVFACLAIVSCSKDDERHTQENKEGTPIELVLRAAIADTYSADKQYFSNGDRIGVYLVDYVGGQPGVLGDIANSSKNVGHALSEDRWIPEVGKQIFLYSSTSDVYAYYPYDAEMGRVSGKRNLAAYPFDIEFNQQATTAKSDFLWAKSTELSDTNSKANLTFEHLLSKIVVNIYNNYPQAEDLKFSIHNTQTSCVINLRNGDVTPADKKRVITPQKQPIPEPNFDLKYEAIVVPQTIRADTPLFSIIVNGDMLIYSVEEDLVLLPHKAYIFNMGVGEAKNRTISPIHLLSLKTTNF
ncbi:MAG: fimbrillin family protein [Prevotellaceae bacterium]|jgi:hypothetical protein|nr:fimbrillin family protein [Prevotellaceae bacterium]